MTPRDENWKILKKEKHGDRDCFIIQNSSNEKYFFKSVKPWETEGDFIIEVFNEIVCSKISLYLNLPIPEVAAYRFQNYNGALFSFASGEQLTAQTLEVLKNSQLFKNVLVLDQFVNNTDQKLKNVLVQDEKFTLIDYGNALSNSAGHTWTNGTGNATWKDIVSKPCSLPKEFQYGVSDTKDVKDMLLQVENIDNTYIEDLIDSAIKEVQKLKSSPILKSNGKDVKNFLKERKSNLRVIISDIITEKNSV